MAMEPNQYNGDISDASYEVQLMNLGRIIENPHLISLFEPEDFLNRDIRMLIYYLKSDKLPEAKNLHLKSFMGRRGARDWGTKSAECKRELFELQRRQKLCNDIAQQTNLVLGDLMTIGCMRDKESMMKTIEAIKGLIDESTRDVHG